METFDPSIYLIVIDAVIVVIVAALAGVFVWVNYLSPWIKSRRVAIRGKDGRR